MLGIVFFPLFSSSVTVVLNNLNRSIACITFVVSLRCGISIAQ